MGKAQITHRSKQWSTWKEDMYACMLCMGKGIMERGYAMAWGKY
jgi:hypothetical protein